MSIHTILPKKVVLSKFPMCTYVSVVYCARSAEETLPERRYQSETQLLFTFTSGTYPAGGKIMSADSLQVVTPIWQT